MQTKSVTASHEFGKGPRRSSGQSIQFMRFCKVLKTTVEN